MLGHVLKSSDGDDVAAIPSNKIPLRQLLEKKHPFGCWKPKFFTQFVRRFNGFVCFKIGENNKYFITHIVQQIVFWLCISSCNFRYFCAVFCLQSRISLLEGSLICRRLLISLKFLMHGQEGSFYGRIWCLSVHKPDYVFKMFNKFHGVMWPGDTTILPDNRNKVA